MARQKKQVNKEKGVNKKSLEFDLHGDTKRSIVAIFLFVFAILITLSFFNIAGIVGEYLNRGISILIGDGKWIAPIFLLYLAITLLRRMESRQHIIKLIGVSIIFASLLGLFHIFIADRDMYDVARAGDNGGYVGYLIAIGLKKATGILAGAIILIATFLIGWIITFNVSLITTIRKIINNRQNMMSKHSENISNEEDDESEGENKTMPDEEQEISGLDDDNDNFNQEDGEKKEKKKKFNFWKKTHIKDFQEKITERENITNIRFDDEKEEKDDLESSEEDGLYNPEENDINPLPNENQKEKFNDEIRRAKKKVTISWKIPPVKLLEVADTKAHGGDIVKNTEIIEETLRNFGIIIEHAGTKIGPTVTQYSFRPSAGVRLTKITALTNDLALALAAHPIRIEAPIPGKSLIGIEVPNKTVATVGLRSMLESTVFKKRKSDVSVALGKDVGGHFIFGDIAKMPHLLIAGSTGSGKSVAVNIILLSLLYQNTPDNLKLILVDPKRVELSLYNGIPHLLADVIVDNSKVVSALKWAVGEMERRYKALQHIGSRDLKSYNSVVGKNGIIKTVRDADTGEEKEEEFNKLPIIIIVIDELADLMASHGKEVEGAIVRLAQMARAVGIHLIVSTQRPSVEVLTGLIKANITTRIALKVATQIDSRTILDSGGAEKLVGNGDMLFLSKDSTEPRRIQGAYVSENEVKDIVDFIKNQKNDDYAENIGEDITSMKKSLSFGSHSSGGSDDTDGDPLYEEAKNIVIQSKKASTSFIQRKLRVGYSRAARLIDMLEADGVVGSAEGSKPRKVLVGGNDQEIAYTDPVEDQMKREKWNM